MSRRFPSLDEAARQMVRLGRVFGARGSVPATSGNFSIRTGERHAAITRSGVDKGHLTEADVLSADIDASPPDGASAETELHLSLYRGSADIGAVLHTHADAAAVLSRVHEAEREVVLTGWELLKALRGVTTHAARVSLHIFPNDQDISALAARVSTSLPDDAVAYLIAGHGLYAWGATVAEAERHAVALEHLMTCELQRRMIRS